MLLLRPSMHPTTSETIIRLSNEVESDETGVGVDGYRLITSHREIVECGGSPERDKNEEKEVLQ